MNTMKKLLLVIGTASFMTIALPVSAAGLEGLLGGLNPFQKNNKPASGTDANSGAALIGELLSTATSKQSADDEILIGDGVAAQVLGAAPIWNNAKAQRYINLVGRYLVQNSERQDLPWAFAIIDTPSINAFAAPGGLVMVTRGLYELLETEDDLAAVLAHEIGHVNRKHHYNVIKQQKMLQTGTGFMQKEVGKDSGAASKLIGVGGELIARGLDKDAEFEADRDAIVLAARGGYDSSSILTVLEKLHAKLATDNGMELLFKTHPAPLERMQRLNAAITPELESAAVPSAAAKRLANEGR